MALQNSTQVRSGEADERYLHPYHALMLVRAFAQTSLCIKNFSATTLAEVMVEADTTDNNGHSDEGEVGLK